MVAADMSSPSQTTVVEVKGLVKNYGEHQAVKGIDFRLHSGEVLGFLGPNGAGKTTTMRIITGYIPPTEGTVTVGGLDVMSDSLKVRRKIGYLPEHPPIYLEFTVRENLEFIAKLRKIPRSERDGRIDKAMERCGLKKVSDRIAGHLSKGFRQRVGLAGAVIHEPEVLILDEPTIGLDPVQIQEIRNLIKELGRKHTVLLSTHILPEVVMTCDRVIIISGGKLVADDTVGELSRKFGGGRKLSLRLDNPGSGVAESLNAINGVMGVAPTQAPGAYKLTVSEGKRIADDVARVVIDSGWGLIEISDEVPSLEEVFVQLTSS
jgi:gliding motility-associated transport system ATP-binding protein